MSSLVEKDTSGIYSVGAGEAEMPTERTRAFKKFSKLTPYKFRVAGQVGPIHYKADPFSASEQFKEIDLTVELTPTESWDAACETNGYQVRFWQSRIIGGKTIRYIAQFRRAGKWIGMAPIALLWVNGANQKQLISKTQAVGAPVIDNDAYRVTWSNVFGSGIDFRYNLRPDEFFKTLIINDKTDLPTPTIPTAGLRLVLVMALSWHGQAKAGNDFASSVTVSDFEDVEDIDSYDEDLDNSDKFDFKDDSLREIFWIQKPKAWDSFVPTELNESAHEINVDWKLRRKGSYIFGLFSVTAQKLNHVDTVFPVYVDTDISEEQTGASSDDCRQTHTDSITLTSTSDFMTHTSLNIGHIGARFTTVPIPQGATIDSAIFEVRTGGNGGNIQDVNVYCEDIDTAPTFTTTGTNISARDFTSNYVLVSQAGDANTWTELPDISSPVQEVISRGGWASNNDLVVITHQVDNVGMCNILFWDYTGNVSGPKFNCGYTEAGGDGFIPKVIMIT